MTQDSRLLILDYHIMYIQPFMNAGGERSIKDMETHHADFIRSHLWDMGSYEPRMLF